MQSQQLNQTTSSAFYLNQTVPSLTIFHPILRAAHQINQEITFRPFQHSDIFEIINLHKEWFPINYGPYFYNNIISQKVNCLVAETTVIIDMHDFQEILKQHNQKQCPIKFKNAHDYGNYYSLKSQSFKSESIQISVIVGLVVFQKTNSQGFLQENWWKGWIENQRNSYYIMTLGVIEEFRKKGVAKMLIQAIIKESQVDEEIRLIYLHVIEYNQAAIKLYQKTGFILLQDISNFYNINNHKFDGKALGIYLKDGAKSKTWWQWVSGWWK